MSGIRPTHADPADGSQRTLRVLVQLIHAAFPLTSQSEPSPQIAAGEWPGIVTVAEAQGLAPLLYRSLKASGRQNDPSVDAMQCLHDSYIRSDVHNGLAFQELERWLDCCAREQIPVVVLKGCALAAMLYPDRGSRAMGDVDLLIPQAAVPRVRALLLAHDYALSPEMVKGFEQQFSGELGFRRAGASPAQVDIHWHLFVAAYYRRRTPIEWFWSRTTNMQIHGQAARVFTPTAQLLHLCTHYALQHRTERLLWLYDIALLLARQADEIDWGELLNAAQNFGLVLPLRSTLSKVSGWWSVALPAEALAALNAYRPGRAERIAFALTTAPQADARTVLDGLNTPGLLPRLCFWLRHLLPTIAYMRTRYHVTHAWLIPFYYVWRVIDGFYKVARSALSILAN